MILTFTLIPTWVMAESIEGSIMGYYSVTSGKIDHVDSADPALAAESLFVIYNDSGEYYFIPNLNRGFLARYTAQRVRITGTVNKRYKTIKAKAFEVVEKGVSQIRWSEDLELEEGLKALQIRMLENLG